MFFNSLYLCSCVFFLLGVGVCVCGFVVFFSEVFLNTCDKGIITDDNVCISVTSEHKLSQVLIIYKSI